MRHLSARLERSSSQVFLSALILGLTVAPWALAQPATQAAPSPPSTTGWYTVRPGDTLRGLSRRLSGAEELWPENWKLNPGVANPDLLSIGSRLRLYLTQAVPPKSAKVTLVHRQVEQRPEPNPWAPAQLGELLEDGDGVRTRERSAAVMSFADGTALGLTEQSLVFFRQVAGELRGVPRSQIEIVQGQGDLEGSRGGRPKSDVELVLGAAHALPRAGDDGALKTRARRPGGGGAQLMMYEGSGAVEAAGQKVEVGRGMGTTVAASGPPTPPEALLPAAELETPKAGGAVAFNNLRFTWKPVAGAASYLLELCSDADCHQAEQRVTGLQAERWQSPQELQAGRYYWRVTAIARSGLDGYPSPVASFEIGSAVADEAVPRIAMKFAGPMAGYGSRLVLGPGSSALAQGEDPESGIAEWTLVLDGKPVPKAAWSGGWSRGAHQLELRAADNAGNLASAEPIAFLYDDVAPRLRWTVGQGELVAQFGHDRIATQRSREEARRLAEKKALLEWSSDGRLWLPLSLPSSGSASSVTVRSDRPQLLVRSATARDPFAASSPVRLAGGALLRVSAEDEACAVAAFSLGIGRAEQSALGSTWVLYLEAEDLVGNRSREEWPLAP